MKKTRIEKGITLIALIITIIILLILAVVTINSIKNGQIIEYAKQAKNDYNAEKEREEGWIENYLAIIDANDPNKGTDSESGEESGSGSEIIPEGGIYTSYAEIATVICEICQCDALYQINIGGTSSCGCGSLSVGTDDGIKYTSGDAFPTNITAGDRYEYGDFEYRYNYSLSSSGYQSNNTQAGWGVGVLNSSKTEYGSILETIAGKPVTNLDYLFQFNNNIQISPKIPSGVISMKYTFNESSLKTPPELPNGLIDMDSTFWMCALSKVDTIEIPSSVINMNHTFAYSLMGLEITITINANPTEYTNCFLGADMSKITLTGSSQKLDALRKTAE